MKKINIAELLKDCPKGMELDCTMFDDVTLLEVIDRPNNRFPIKIAIGANRFRYLTETGGYDLIPETKCVIFPKGKTTWKGFIPPCKFKDGDVVATNSGTWIGITTGGESGDLIPTYCVIKDNGTFEAYLDTKRTWYFSRFATEEEKQKLFKAIKENGYKWNKQTKILGKLVEPKFHVGDWVVNKFGDVWHIDSFNSEYYQVSNGNKYCYFLIEEQNEMHLWTIDDTRDGDVLACNEEILLFKSYSVQDGISLYCWYNRQTNNFHNKEVNNAPLTIIDKIYPATKEQRDLLYQKIKENGYEWNFETKTLEKVIKPEFKVGDIIQDLDSYKVTITKVHIEEEYYEYESVITKGIGSIRFLEQSTWELVPNKFDITTLKPFDKVLVRQNITGKWGIDFFGSYNEGYYHATGGCAYRYCIPYEGNEHLRDTRKDCDEYYKVWE